MAAMLLNPAKAHSTAVPRQVSSSELLSTLDRVISTNSLLAENPWWFPLWRQARWQGDVGEWFVFEAHTQRICVAHLVDNIPNNEDRSSCRNKTPVHDWRLNLFALDGGVHEADKVMMDDKLQCVHDSVVLTSTMVAEHMSQIATSCEAEKVVLTIAALDPLLLPAVIEAFTSHNVLQMKSTYLAKCGLYTFKFQGESGSISATPSLANAIVRQLVVEDAAKINENWEYKSSHSLSKIMRMLQSTNTADCCIGIEDEGELVAWILQYENGELGMLFCCEDYRKKGYATALVDMAVEKLQRKAHPQAFVYIADGNSRSERMFLKLGWKRVCGADWIGFSSQSNPKTDSSKG